ncbi:uncharacterized protein OCT59_013245 [Rhizophagus irregularis]|uniref:uncharacterized protein n=1 Tax=Rhizophagus irregularis TaxID=588596 RepID=UPI000CC7F16A|nr:hypothetical protein OCT59_013245 [Rhizophagus irregularis]CAG8629781.1 3179_t:CDS:1 [Rhizophagus irregularis]
MEFDLVRDLTRFQNTYHQRISSLLTSIRELDELSSDTDSSSASQSWQSIKQARLLKRYYKFEVPFTTVINVNQPHYADTRNQYMRMVNPSLKRKKSKVLT